MKRIVLFAAFAVLSLSAFAQDKSIVGKWKLTTLNSQGVNFNVDNPEQMKSELKKQFEASGAQADSAMIDMIFKSMMDALGNMVFDFGSNGKLVVNMSVDGSQKKEEEDYTVDYTKSLIISKGKEKEQKINFRFEKENLVLVIDEEGKKSEMTLKKIN